MLGFGRDEVDGKYVARDPKLVRYMHKAQGPFRLLSAPKEPALDCIQYD